MTDRNKLNFNRNHLLTSNQTCAEERSDEFKNPGIYIPLDLYISSLIVLDSKQ